MNEPSVELVVDPLEIEKQHTERVLCEERMRMEDRSHVLIPREELLRLQDRVSRLDAIVSYSYTQHSAYLDKDIILAIAGVIMEEK